MSQLFPEPSNRSSDRVPIALTIAGSDSGGGAGIQADLKAFSALGVYGTSVVTAVTAQNTRAVTAVHEIPLDVIADQIEAVLDDIQVDAIKIGMLSSVGIIETVVSSIKDFRGAIVLDPVMVAKSGDHLLRADAVDALRSLLLPRANLVTPNLPEAGTLLDRDVAHSTDQVLEQGAGILALGCGAVLMKGGHAEGNLCQDYLIAKSGEVICLEAKRIATANTHGTGCTLSASIAAGLAQGLDLADAVSEAHAYLHDAIVRSDELGVGSGHGPVHHFHAVW